MGLGLAEPGFATACYVEIEEYPRKCLIAAQRAGYMHTAPIWDDLKTFNARPWRGSIDTILAGYPCQPFSQAGQRKGEKDPRHLWPDIERIIEELDPRWCFFENVSGHFSLGLDTVLRSLQEMGFRVAAGLFSAEETGATHERQRVFIVAYRSGIRTGELDYPTSPRHDAEGQRSSAISQGREQVPCDGCDELADSNGGNAPRIRRGEGRPEHEFRSGRNTPTSTSGELADADSNADTRRLDSGRNRSGSGESERDQQCRERVWIGSGRSCGSVCRELADTELDAGHQGRCRHRVDNPPQGNRETTGLSARRPLLHPPGPNDMDAWRYVLASAPELAPALSLGDVSTFSRYFASLIEAGELSQAEAERRLCRMADGLEHRSRALRLLGNAVHPLTAAHAWRSLSDAIGLGNIDFGEKE